MVWVRVRIPGALVGDSPKPEFGEFKKVSMLLLIAFVVPLLSPAVTGAALCSVSLTSSVMELPLLPPLSMLEPSPNGVISQSKPSSLSLVSLTRIIVTLVTI